MTHQRLSQHAEPRIDEERLARQRAAIVAKVRHRERPRRTRYALLALAAACLVACLVVVLRPRGAPQTPPLAGTVLETTASAMPMTLRDGTRVTLDPESKLSLLSPGGNAVRLELARGGVDLDVVHQDDRPFVVAASGHEVHVLGTRFSVRFLTVDRAPSLEVRVERGRVRVTRDADKGYERLLAAGEVWTVALGPPVPAPVEVEPSPVALDLDLDATPAIAPASATRPPVRPGARELWADAEAARTSRRYQDEARALDQLRLRHRSDARAGLAAFELGRLRQDTLGDPSGAAEAFADAVVLAPGGPFREDAEARRVEALETAGQRRACAEARTAFLARYPSSVHRQRVTTRCPTP